MCLPCCKKQAPALPPPPPNSEITPPVRVAFSRSHNQVSMNSRLNMSSVSSVSNVATSVLEKSG